MLRNTVGGGGGVSNFAEKSVTNKGVRFNVISVTMVWVGGFLIFQEKSTT